MSSGCLSAPPLGESLDVRFGQSATPGGHPTRIGCEAMGSRRPLPWELAVARSPVPNCHWSSPRRWEPARNADDAGQSSSPTYRQPAEAHSSRSPARPSPPGRSRRDHLRSDHGSRTSRPARRPRPGAVAGPARIRQLVRPQSPGPGRPIVNARTNSNTSLTRPSVVLRLSPSIAPKGGGHHAGQHRRRNRRLRKGHRTTTPN